MEPRVENFPSEAARDEAAKAHRLSDPDGENGIFWLNACEDGEAGENGPIEVGSYWGGFEEEEDDA